MTVVCPGDAVEVRGAVRAALRHDGPVYMRIGKKRRAGHPHDVPEFRIGKRDHHREGRRRLHAQHRQHAAEAVAAAEALRGDGLSARVVSFHTVKPLDEALLAEAFDGHRVSVTIEEHSLLGGLGGAIAEWLADHGPRRARLLRFGTADAFLHETRGQKSARQQLGLDAETASQAGFGRVSQGRTTVRRDPSVRASSYESRTPVRSFRVHRRQAHVLLATACRPPRILETGQSARAGRDIDVPVPQTGTGARRDRVHRCVSHAAARMPRPPWRRPLLASLPRPRRERHRRARSRARPSPR